MSVLLALIAAVAYGASDFAGGLASRRVRALEVLAISYPLGTVLTLGLMPWLPGSLDAASVWWSIGAGLAGTVGVGLLYLGLSTGPMGVVAPITAVVAAVVPVAVGVSLGERPPVVAYLGVLLALGAVVLVSRGGPADAGSRVSSRAVGYALIAGAGFGLYFVLLDRTGDDTGGWPLVVSRGAATAVILAAVLSGRSRGARPLPTGNALRLAAAASALDVVANLTYLLAVREGLLSLVSVLVALYPATTVWLASMVLGERSGRVQRLGMVLAAGSVAAIAWAS